MERRGDRDGGATRGPPAVQAARAGGHLLRALMVPGVLPSAGRDFPREAATRCHQKAATDLLYYS